MSVFEQLVLFFALVIGIGGGWSVVWWFRAFPTRPTEIVHFESRRRVSQGTPRAVSYSCSYGALSLSSYSPHAFQFVPGAVWPAGEGERA